MYRLCPLRVPSVQALYSGSIDRCSSSQAAAAKQQQELQQRRRRAQEGACGGLGGGYEACAAGEPLEAPGGVAGPHAGGLPAVTYVHAGFHEKSWDRRYVLVCMCARMYVMCGVRHRVIRAERYALVCVALHGVRGFKII